MPTTTPFNNLITFSRGSNATVTGSNGLIQWAPNNLLTFSEQFDNAAWGKSLITITANSSEAPDNTITADRIVSAGGAFPQISQAATLLAGQAYTFSIWVRSDGTTQIQQTILLEGQLTNFTPTSTWQRISVTVSSSAGGSRSAVIATNNGSAPASSFLIWGAQLELGSTATTYNPTTVKNLLGFSEAFDNAAWVKSNSSIVTGAQANPVNGLFNAQKLMENTANTAHRVQQTVNISGAPITLSAYLKAGERTWAYLRLDDASSVKFAYFNLATGAAGFTTSGVTSSITSVGSGWYRCSITFAAPAATAIGTGVIGSTTADNTATNVGDGNSGVYIYGAQLSDSASLDPYVPTPGAAPSSTAFYGPRFDFDPVTLQPRGLLVEEQRTNLATYSNDFADASWTAFGAKNLAANSTVSPDGAVNASTLTDNSAVAFQGMGKTVTVANDNATYTASIYVRKTTGGTSATFGVNLQLTGGTLVTAQPRLNTDTGVLLNGTGTVQNAGAYWRLTTSVTNNTTGNTTLALAMYPATAAYNSGTDSSAATGSAILYGAQLEAGAFATSYIPTVASTVTRSADVATITGQNFAQWFTQPQGSFVAEMDTLYSNVSDTVTIRAVFTADDGTANNLHRVYQYTNTYGGNTIVGGVNQSAITLNTIAVNTPAKASYAYEVNSFSAAMNGTLGTPDTSGTLPTPNRLAFGAVWPVNGHIRSIRFIPARAADFQLQALST